MSENMEIKDKSTSEEPGDEMHLVNGTLNGDVPIVDVDEEKEKTERELRNKIRTLYLTMLLTMTSIAIGISSTWPYMQKIDPKVSPNFLGWTNFAFNLAAIVADLIAGRWMVRRNAREPLLASILVVMLSGFVFAFAQGMGRYNGLTAVLISRALLGLGRGNLTVLRTVVSESTTPAQRSVSMANLIMFMGAGFTIGSGIQTAFVQIGENGLYISALRMHLNLYTIPAYIIVMLTVINIVAVLRYVKPVSQSHELQNTSVTFKTQKKETDKFPLVTLILLFCLVNFTLSIMETLMTPFVQHQFALTRPKAVFYSGLVFTVQGIVAFSQQFNVKFLTKRFKDRLLVGIAFSCIIAQFFLYIPYSSGGLKITGSLYSNRSSNSNSSALGSELVGCPREYKWCHTSGQVWLPKFLLGAFLFAIGYSSCLGLLISLFTKLIPFRWQRTGVSVISAFGNVGRLTAPIAGAASYVDIGPTYTFTWLALLLLIGLGTFAACYKGLNTIMAKPFDRNTETDDEKQLQENVIDDYRLLLVTPV